jgi:hypothetical protein
MKNKFLLLSLTAAIFISCESDDTADIVINDNSVTTVNNNTTTGTPPVTRVNLNGLYSTDLTLDPAIEYVITGPVLMASGTTLTIPAGMTVKALPIGVNAYIAIQQGAKINANGTAANPIILTSNATAPSSGNWGGLVLLGRAPINSTADGSTAIATSEVGALAYGGNSPADDSGIVKYVRIEYAGGAIDGNAELNGLSVYAAGTGTTIDYVQIFEGSDDGFEFFGGTVNASHLVVVNAEDDSVDWTEGFTGTLTDIYVQQDMGKPHDSGFECDGFNTDFSFVGGSLSKPTVKNVTIIGDGDSGRAFRLRAGSQGIFTNVVVSNFQRGFVIEDDQATFPTSAGVAAGNLSATNVAFATSVTTPYTGPVPQANFIKGNASAATGTAISTWGAGWTRGIK